MARANFKLDLYREGVIAPHLGISVNSFAWVGGSTTIMGPFLVPVHSRSAWMTITAEAWVVLIISARFSKGIVSSLLRTSTTSNPAPSSAFSRDRENL